MNDQALILPESLRARLKKPMGPISQKLDAELIADKTIICIGDQASRQVLNAGLKPKLVIYDQRCERKEIGTTEEIKKFKAIKHQIKNPPATINLKVFPLLKEIFTSSKTHKLEVEGEEDLITLPSIYLAPFGWVVIYGQPGEGIVIAKVDEKLKHDSHKTLKDMGMKDEF